MVATGFQLRIRSGGAVAVPLMPMTLQTSVAYRGATYNFDRPVLIGLYADGQLCALSDRVFNISSMSPASVQIASSTFTMAGVPQVGKNLWANGAMVDPYFGANGGTLHGFDEMMSYYADDTGQTQALFTYDHARNIDPGATGSAFAVSIGMNTSVVKCTRATGLTTPGQWRIFQDWSALHIVSVVPPAGAFAPGASDTNKTSYATTGARNKAALGAGFAQSSGMPSLATCTVPGAEYFYGWNGCFFGFGAPTMGADSRRRMVITNSGDYSGYSGAYGQVWAKFMAALLAQGSAVDDTQLNLALGLGAQLVGLQNRSLEWGYGAGQSCGYKQFAQLFGHVFASVSGLMTKCLGINGNVTGQPIWNQANMEGEAVSRPGNHGLMHATVESLHVGKPYFSVEPVRNGSYVPAPSVDEDTDCPTDYEFTALAATFPEMMNINLLKQGPSGWDGSQVIARSASDFTNSNQYAACISYFDRAATYPDYWGIAPFDTSFLNYYNDRRAGVVAPKWTGIPDAFNPTQTLDTTFVSAISGGFQWNLSAAKLATETVLEWDIDYSTDGLLYKTVDTPGVSGTQTGLTVTPTFVRHRRRSTSGWGARSINTPRADDGRVVTATLTSGGIGYVDGTYRYVPLTGGTGYGAIADIVVSGGVVTSVTLVTQRTGYLVGGGGYTALDALSASNFYLGGTGAGLTYTVNTVSSTTGGPGVPRFMVTPTGTPSNAAPVFTKDPAIVAKQYPLWGGNSYADASGQTITRDQLNAGTSVGVGYVTGYPVPTFSYQKLRGGSPVGAATLYPPIADVDDSNSDISCEVTATNSQGSAVKTTPTAHVSDLFPAVSYTPVGFDGSTTYYSWTAFTGLTDGKQGTLAFIFNMGDTGVGRYLLNLGGSGAAARVYLLRSSGNQLQFLLRNAAGTGIGVKNITAPTAGVDHTILISWDLAAGLFQMWLDGVDQGAASTLTNDTIDYTPSTNSIGLAATGIGAALWLGTISMGYFTNSYVVLTTPTDRDKFLAANINTNGSGPTGARPVVFMCGTKAVWNAAVNRGTGGDPTLHGAVT